MFDVSVTSFNRIFEEFDANRGAVGIYSAGKFINGFFMLSSVLLS